MQPGWDDDHLVLDELELLGESPLWVEIFSLPTQSSNCDIANCQNVVGGRNYKIVGDVEDAKASALEELLRSWEPTNGVDLSAESIDFRLRDEVEIDTKSGTAFLTVSFAEDREIWPDGFVEDAILLTFTSDIDPDLWTDTVLKRDNFTPLGVGVAIAVLGLVVLGLVSVLKRPSKRVERLQSLPPQPPSLPGA